MFADQSQDTISRKRVLHVLSDDWQTTLNLSFFHVTKYHVKTIPTCNDYKMKLLET